MDWKSSINGFKTYLQLEKSLSENSITAYVRDVSKVVQYLESLKKPLSPEEMDLSVFQSFLSWANELGMTDRSQARTISGIKAFYKYLLLENLIKDDPTELLEAPKVGLKLPEVLSIEEINLLFDAIDQSKPEGVRNKTMLETMYGSGLRVSELINLKKTDVFASEGFLRVTGKGNKERLVPIGRVALKQIELYSNEIRSQLKVEHEFIDVLFLNRRGTKLSRVMIFKIIKKSFS